MGAKSRGTEFWKAHVAAAAESDLSPMAYCKKHGLTSSLFYRWRCRLKTGAPKPGVKTRQLVPVEIVDSSRRRGVETSLRMELPGLGSVEIRGDFGAVARLIQLVRWESA